MNFLWKSCLSGLIRQDVHTSLRMFSHLLVGDETSEAD